MTQVTNQRLKTCYKPFRSWTPIHTGGEATFSSTCNLLFTIMDEEVLATNLNSGKRLHTFEGDSSIVTSITCTPSNSNPTLLIAYRSLSIRIYTLLGSFIDPETTNVNHQKSIAKAHEAPISISISDPTSSVFATGDTAGVVKLWDVKNGHCTHVFKGHQLVSALSFDVNKSEARARLAVGSSDGKIKLWDLRTNQLINVFEHGHVSVIRGLSITKDGNYLVSGSRDKVLNLWLIESSKVTKTIPVYETIESIGLINKPEEPISSIKSKGKSKAQAGNSLVSPLEGLTVFTAGDKGLIRLWDLESGQQIGSEEEKSTGDNKFPRTGIFDTCYDEETQTLLVTKINQTFSILKLPSLEIIRQIVGSHDEIIDTSLLNSSTGTASHLALATNSPVIRILSLGPEENHTELLSGHNDVVLCLTKSEDSTWFVSGSKDKTARVWKQSVKEDKRIQWDCVGICEGHMQALGAVSLTEFKDLQTQQSVSILATASQDRTVKLWDLTLISKLVNNQEINQMKSLLTLKVHEKDINTIGFCKEGKLFATGSQDKLCKVFKLNHTTKEGTSLEILGILKGHTRGIWTLKFSKFEKVLVTGSGDCSIKLWSIDQTDEQFGNCLKTFDGHLNAILRLDFINFGSQIVSTSSDSLIKIWEIKNQVCLSTLGDESIEEEIAVTKKSSTIEDESKINHDSKIWALEIQEDGQQIITAGSDSKIIYWKDITEEKLMEKFKLKEEEMRLNQDLENYIRLKDYKTVICLLIKLNKSVRLLKLFNEILEEEEENEEEGVRKIDEVLKELKTFEVLKLLIFCRDWNSLTKTQEISHKVLYGIFKFHSYKTLLNSIEESKSTPEEEEEGNLNGKFKGRKGKETLKEVLDSLSAYSERYLSKVEKVGQELNVLGYILNQMEGGICEF